MKRKFVLLAGMLFIFSGVFTGCGGSADKVAGSQDKATEQEKMTEEEKATDQIAGTEKGILKTGLAVISNLSQSENAGEEDGIVQADVTLAAVTIDESGKIVTCGIDGIQLSVNFDKEGRIMTDLTADYPTKQELGYDYGMKKASAIGKEWFEQADAFAAYCVGKTADEINGIAVTEYGAPADVDLAASCTISIGDFQAAVIKAIHNAK